MSKKPKDEKASTEKVEPTIDKTEVATEKVEPTDPAVTAEADKVRDLIEYARTSGVHVPPGIKTIFISEDKQIFLNPNNAWTHCKENGLKYYNVSWD